MTQLRHGSGLNLADPFARETKARSDFFERTGLAATDTEPEPDDLALTVVEDGQHLGHLARKQGRCRRFERRHCTMILHQVAQFGVAFVTDGL